MLRSVRFPATPKSNMLYTADSHKSNKAGKNDNDLGDSLSTGEPITLNFQVTGLPLEETIMSPQKISETRVTEPIRPIEVPEYN